MLKSYSFFGNFTLTSLYIVVKETVSGQPELSCPHICSDPLRRVERDDQIGKQ